MISFSQFASKVAKEEGKKHQASIADTRELLHFILSELAKMPYQNVAQLLKRYKIDN